MSPRSPSARSVASAFGDNAHCVGPFVHPVGEPFGRDLEGQLSEPGQYGFGDLGTECIRITALAAPSYRMVAASRRWRKESVSRTPRSPPTKDLGCDCFIAGGYLVITTRHGTVTVPFSGLAHRLRIGGGDGSGLFQIGAEMAESFGTGDYKDSHGAGMISALFDEPGVRVVLDVRG